MEENELSNFQVQAPIQYAPLRPLPTDEYQKNQASQRLAETIGNAQEVLAAATTVFPLTWFPDTIAVSRTQLSIAHRSFFKVAQVASIRVEDVLDVIANVGPFFGSLRITTRFFDHPPYYVNWLHRHDALRLKRIIQGYITALKKQTDLTALSVGELAFMLDRLGQGVVDAG